MDNSITLGPLECLTTAPEDYDYSWMRTVARNVAVDRDGKTYRLARNQDEWHFKTQIARYQSGLHIALHHAPTIAEWLPTPERRANVHDLAFDFEPTLESGSLDAARDKRRKLDELMEAIDGDALPKDVHGRWDGLIARFRCAGDAARDRIVALAAELGLSPTPEGNADDA